LTEMFDGAKRGEPTTTRGGKKSPRRQTKKNKVPGKTTQPGTGKTRSTTGKLFRNAQQGAESGSRGGKQQASLGDSVWEKTGVNGDQKKREFKRGGKYAFFSVLGGKGKKKTGGGVDWARPPAEGNTGTGKRDLRSVFKSALRDINHAPAAGRLP